MVIIPTIIGTKLIELSTNLLMGVVGSIVGEAVKEKLKGFVNRASARLGRGLVFEKKEKTLEEMLETQIVPFTTDLLDLVIKEAQRIKEENPEITLEDTEVVSLVNQAVKQTVDYTLELHQRSNTFQNVEILKEELTKNKANLIKLGLEDYNLLIHNLDLTLKESLETIELMVGKLHIDHHELKEILQYVLTKIERQLSRVVEVSKEEVIEEITKSTEVVLGRVDEAKVEIVDQVIGTSGGIQEGIKEIIDQLTQSYIFHKGKDPTLKVTSVAPPKLIEDIERAFNFEFTESYSILDIVGVYYITRGGLPIYGELYESFPADSSLWAGMIRASYSFIQDSMAHGDPVMTKGRYTFLKMGEEMTVQFWGSKSPKTGDILVLLLDPKVPLTNYETGLKNHVIATMKEIDENEICKKIIDKGFIGEKDQKRLKRTLHTLFVKNLGIGLLFPLYYVVEKLTLCPQQVRNVLKKMDRPDGLLLRELWTELRDNYLDKEIIQYLADILELGILIPVDEEAFYLPVKKNFEKKRN